MGIRFTNLANTITAFSSKGVGDKIRGGSLATQSSRDAALRTQVQCAPNGRRIVCRGGVQGAERSFVQTGFDPEIPSLQIYPLATQERVIARQRVRITPGYWLQVHATFLPTGPAQQFALGEWSEGKPGGFLRVDVSWTNGVSTETSSIKMTPNVSDLEYKSLPTTPGGCWGVLQAMESTILRPPSAALPAWSEHVEASIAIVAIGGVRPLDVIVYEKPQNYTRSEVYRECTIPNFPAAGAGEYPITALEQPTDPTQGSQQANKSIGDQRGVWGPVLATWSSWQEASTAATTEGAPVIVTQTTFRDLSSTTITGYSASNPGWSVSSGGYARNLEHSGALELRDKVGAIPVICRVYARMTNAAHTGTVRFQTADYSYRDLTVTGSTAFGWYSGLAWLRVPVHASIDSLLQVLCKVGGAGQQLEVRAMSVEYGGHYTIAQ